LEEPKFSIPDGGERVERVNVILIWWGGTVKSKMPSITSITSSWFCQYLGVRIPKLQQAASPQLVCPCDRHIIVHGDHIHTYSLKDANRTILPALEQIGHGLGLTTCRYNIPAVMNATARPVAAILS
jgi:hypothetical protein